MGRPCAPHRLVTLGPSVGMRVESTGRCSTQELLVSLVTRRGSGNWVAGSRRGAEAVEEHGACCGELAWSEGGERIGDGMSHQGEEVLAASRSGGAGDARDESPQVRGEGLLHLEVVEACGFDGEMVGRLPGGESMAKGSDVRGELRHEMAGLHATVAGRLEDWLTDADLDRVRGDAIHGQADLRQPTAGQAPRQKNVHLVQPREAALCSGIEHGCGDAANRAGYRLRRVAATNPGAIQLQDRHAAFGPEIDGDGVAAAARCALGNEV